MVRNYPCFHNIDNLKGLPQKTLEPINYLERDYAVFRKNTFVSEERIEIFRNR